MELKPITSPTAPTRYTTPVIIVDPAFREMVPALRDYEREQLEENLVRDGCRDPLVVWRKEGILVDGHNRYEICQRRGIAFNVVERDFPDREAVADWIDSNQLGRRNLSPDQATIIRGRRYNRAKRQGARTDLTSGHNVHKSQTTAERLALEHGVDEKTIRRDGQFASAVDKLKSIDPEIERKVVSGAAPPKASITKAAELLENYPDAAKAIILGEKTVAKARTKAASEPKKDDGVCALDVSKSVRRAIWKIYQKTPNAYKSLVPIKFIEFALMTRMPERKKDPAPDDRSGVARRRIGPELLRCGLRRLRTQAQTRGLGRHRV